MKFGHVVFLWSKCCDNTVCSLGLPVAQDYQPCGRKSPRAGTVQKTARQLGLTGRGTGLRGAPSLAHTIVRLCLLRLLFPTFLLMLSAYIAQ